MHPCLDVDEIVRLIARGLVLSSGRASSVALASCCKNLEDPVLDVLWETQGLLLPLLKTLPGDVWNPDEDECTVSALTMGALSLLNDLVSKSFQRLPTTLEWAHFRKYARRMRRLEVSTNLYSEVLSVLQFCGVDNPVFPNLEFFYIWPLTQAFIPSIPLFLSPRTTTITISFFEIDAPKSMVASMITAFPTLCPDLQDVALYSLPEDQMITVGVSRMLLASNRNTLRRLVVDSPLTKEAREVVYKLTNLRELSMVIKGDDISLPLVVLPNLSNLTIKYDHNDSWLRGFHRATFGGLTSVTFESESEPISDFLEAFESVAFTTSTPATLSAFRFYTSRLWRPNYRSLLPFTQLKDLQIQFSCGGGCSSTIDDDTIADIARAMPKLQTLHLGNGPCQIPTGVTVKGLATLAYYCPHLSSLSIHFQVASLGPPAITGVTPSGEPAIPREDCALTCLYVGGIPLPEESALVVTLTLLRIFPHISYISYFDEGWKKVTDAISCSKQIVDHSSKNLRNPHSLHLEVDLMMPLPGTTLGSPT